MSQQIGASWPIERAQVVWQRALELAGACDDRDPSSLALELARSSDHDPAAIAHALSIGRHRLREDRPDPRGPEGLALLEAALGLLGARSHS